MKKFFCFMLIMALAGSILTGNFQIAALSSVKVEKLTDEEVKEAFKDENFQRRIAEDLDGIFNSTRPDSTKTDIPLDHIFIGKKPFRIIKLYRNGKKEEEALAYVIYGEKSNGEKTGFGYLMGRKVNGEVELQYMPVSNSIPEILKNSKKIAVFLDSFTQNSNNSSDIPFETNGALFGINEKNELFPIDSKLDSSYSLPSVKFEDVKEADGCNIIDSETLSPGYTLQGKPVALLSSGEKNYDNAKKIVF